MGDLPVYSGSFGDIWRGVYNERPVAIKGLRVYRKGDIREIKRVGCDKSGIPAQVNLPR